MRRGPFGLGGFEGGQGGGLGFWAKGGGALLRTPWGGRGGSTRNWTAGYPGQLSPPSRTYLGLPGTAYSPPKCPLGGGTVPTPATRTG